MCRPHSQALEEKPQLVCVYVCVHVLTCAHCVYIMCAHRCVCVCMCACMLFARVCCVHVCTCVMCEYYVCPCAHTYIMCTHVCYVCTCVCYVCMCCVLCVCVHMYVYVCVLAHGCMEDRGLLLAQGPVLWKVTPAQVCAPRWLRGLCLEQANTSDPSTAGAALRPSGPHRGLSGEWLPCPPPHRCSRLWISLPCGGHF